MYFLNMRCSLAVSFEQAEPFEKVPSSFMR